MNNAGIYCPVMGRSLACPIAHRHVVIKSRNKMVTNESTKTNVMLKNLEQFAAIYTIAVVCPTWSSHEVQVLHLDASTFFESLDVTPRVRARASLWYGT